MYYVGWSLEAKLSTSFLLLVREGDFDSDKLFIIAILHKLHCFFKIDITFKMSRCELWDYLTGVEVSGTGVLLEHQWKGGHKSC